MVLMDFLWCALAVIVVVLAWVTLQLNLAVRKEVRVREELMSQLSLRHHTDMSSQGGKLP